MNHTWTIISRNSLHQWLWAIWFGPVNIIKQILENYLYIRYGLKIVIGAMSHSVKGSNYWGNGWRERWLTNQQKKKVKNNQPAACWVGWGSVLQPFQNPQLSQACAMAYCTPEFHVVSDILKEHQVIKLISRSQIRCLFYYFPIVNLTFRVLEYTGSGDRDACFHQ